MRKRVFGLVLVGALLSSGALASIAAAAVRVYVTPSSGRPTTKFVVRFRVPSATSTALHRRYELSASGPRAARCTSSIAMALSATHAGAQVRATLKPKSTWCAGTFRGRIVEYTSIICQPIKAVIAIVCPDIVIAPQTIGRFSFRVRHTSSSTTGTGTPTAGPSFAGLQSATTCRAPGPKALPTQQTYELTWAAASDPTTPSSQIVYEIFYSATSGGENYSSPTWTTPPGVTQYSVTIPGVTPAYFVVRARDAAGRVDDNTVQRLAVNTCTDS